MKRETKLVHKEVQEQEAHLDQTSQSSREFSTAEEMLRYDAAQTEVPPGIARRLAESTNNSEPDPAPEADRSWWRKLWGNSK